MMMIDPLLLRRRSCWGWVYALASTLNQFRLRLLAIPVIRCP